MRPILLCLLSILFLLSMGSGLGAQELRLSKRGGALGETTELLVEGQPGRTYWVVFDFVETRTDLENGLFLDVSLRWLNYSALLPGFMGSLNASGRARVEFVLPDVPALDPATMSLQCVYCSPVDEVSKLQRITPAYAGTFEETLEAPPVPLLSGVAIPAEDGSVGILGESLAVLQRYDPDLEEFTLEDLGCALGPLSTQTVLEDGRVFLAGGLSLEDGQPSDRALLYDPVLGECQELQLPSPRAGHAAALVRDGEVLLCGGFESLDLGDLLALFAGLRDDAVLFDPSDLSFRPAGRMLEPKALHTATTTEDGDVLVAGGLTLVPIVDLPFVSPTAYLWDDRSEDFGLVPLFFGTGRLAHGAARLSDGKVLLAGGLNVDFSAFLESGDPLDLAIVSVDSGEVWEDGFLGGGFESIPGMSAGRALPAVVALPRRRALVVGGLELQVGAELELVLEPRAEADVYVDRDGAFAPTGRLLAPRIDPIAVPLPDGTVLVVGGGALGAEVYQPED